MTQEDKELLLKDLCARLPYGVKCAIFNKDLGFGGISGFEGKYPFVIDGITQEGDDVDVWLEHGNFSLETVKPYLFPLSSMSEEQYENFIIISGWDGDIEDIRRGKFSCMGYIGLDYIYDTIDWFLKNHFDYRGHIPKGLAIDATGLNIY